MKILLVNNGYPTEFNPNFSTFIKSIGDCLISTGNTVDKLVLSYNCKKTIWNKILQYMKFWYRCLTCDLNYDIIYVNHLPYSWPILFNKDLKNKRLIIHWHGNELISKSIFTKLTHKIIKKKSNRMEHIVPSKYFKNKLIQILSIHNNIYISPSGGVDTDIFYPNNTHFEDQISIGFASGLVTDKGADLILELMKYHNELEDVINRRIIFKIINYGVEAEKYIRLYKETGAKVEFINKMHKNDMPNFYNSISILVMPSKREGESLGLVALEAMSCDIPVITHDICAFPEFIISGISGERCQYSENIYERTELAIKCLKKILINYTHYHPRKVITERYSKHSVIQFYKELLQESK